MPPLIWARGLTKHYQVAVRAPGLGGALRHLIRPRYEQKIAVQGLDLSIEAGESVACLGPNGAGKSTTIKMLTGLLVPTSGELRVRGLVPHQDRRQNARNISVVFGQRTQLWWDLPVLDSLRMVADIYEVPAARFKENLGACVELLQLEPFLGTPARSLSLGQRMRCDLAAALLHDPAILFLDEPTIGLDLAVKARLRTFIKEMNQRKGVTILLTSHDLDDIEGLCQRLVIIDKGQLLFDGTPAALHQRFGQERILYVSLRVPLEDAMARCGAAVAAWGARVEQPSPREVLISFDPGRTNAAAVIGAVLPLLPAEDLQVREPRIETVIRRIYEGETPGGPR